MPQFQSNVDLAKNELRNARVQNLGSAPATPLVGQLYYDTTTFRLLVWNGTAWALVATDADALGGSTRAAVLSRTNHTDSQAASTISDFHTQVRTSRLDQMATPTVAVSMNAQRLTNVAAPIADTDAATRGFVAGLVNGTDWKASVRAATTANIDLTTGGLLTIDGVGLAAGNRALVKNQTTASQNGIYVVASGAWTRATDADTDAEVSSGMAVFVEEGTTNGNQQWVLSTDNPITLGTTALVFSQIGATGGAPAAGAGLTLVSNTYDVGAGNGILVDPDAVRVDPIVVGRKFTAPFGDGTATSYTIAHNLGNQWVTAQVVRNSTPFDVVWADVDLTDANNVRVYGFGVAPTANQFRVNVIG